LKHIEQRLFFGVCVEEEMNLSLKTSILETGMKQYHLAELAQIDPTRLSKIVGGHVQPRVEEKKRIAEVLGRPVEEFFKDT
jgi:transcriptional regulator with XRE-family HTH domain